MFNSMSISRSLQITFLVLFLSVVALGSFTTGAINQVKKQFTNVVERNITLLSTVSDLRYYDNIYQSLFLFVTDNRWECSQMNLKKLCDFV